MSTKTLPGVFRSGVTTFFASISATAVTTSVGGIELRDPSASVHALFNESLPETKGVLNAIDAAHIPSTVDESCPSTIGSRGSPHEKLSSSEHFFGLAPAHTELRIASSTTSQPIASGSAKPNQGFTPIPIAKPVSLRGSIHTVPSL